MRYGEEARRIALASPLLLSLDLLQCFLSSTSNPIVLVHRSQTIQRIDGSGIADISKSAGCIGADKPVFVIKYLDQRIDRSGVTDIAESRGSVGPDKRVLILQGLDERIDRSGITDIAESNGSILSDKNSHH